MTRLGVVSRLRAKKIDIEDLEIAGEVLELHPRSGHPIVRLLPTVRNHTAGAAYEEHFVGQIAIDMPESAESDSGLEEVHFVNMKKGVRRRFVGLTTAATQVHKRQEPRVLTGKGLFINNFTQS